MAWFFSTFTNTIRKSTHKKTPSPKLTFENSALLRLQGFEPWTNRLRVYCSTSWAKGACDMKYFNASSTILHRGWKINPQFEIFLIFYTIPSTVLFFVSFFVLPTGFADTFFQLAKLPEQKQQLSVQALMFTQTAVQTAFLLTPHGTYSVFFLLLTYSLCLVFVR